MNFLKQNGLSLFVTCMFLFLYLPIIILVAYSFNQGEFPHEWQGFSLHWYYDLFTLVEIWRAFHTSLIVALSAAVLSLVLGMTIVYASRKLHTSILSLFYLNVISPDIALAVGLLSLFAYFVIPLGLVTLIIGHTVLGLGFAIPILKNRMDEMDERLIEASYDLGATEWYTFFHVVLPFMYPALFVAALLVIIVSFDDFLISFFCAGSSAQTLSLYIFSMIRCGVSPIVNALSTLMLVVSSIFVFGISWFNISTFENQDGISL
ncbi:ABC transporter permease [bacterium]|jgi:spermidine/putrescine transport system permease protein|nr:ABC transporter permease [bacterium]